MNHDGLRSALVQLLRDACAPIVVADEEPELVTATTVVVCWTGFGWSTDALGWVHSYEVRIILPVDNAAAHFRDRDRAVNQVGEALRQWRPGASRHPSKPSGRLGTATVGTTEHRAVLITTNVYEPPEE